MDKVKRYTAAEVRFSTQGGNFVLEADYDAELARSAVLEDTIDKLSLAFDSRVKTIGQLLSEVAALREDLATTKKQVFYKHAALEAKAKALTAAEQRNAELERDAARYRYLRDPDNRDGLESEDVIVVGIAEGEDIVWLEQMDQAIDVMMESINPTESGASKPKICIECGQPYCLGVCVERGDEQEVPRYEQ